MQCGQSHSTGKCMRGVTSTFSRDGGSSEVWGVQLPRGPPDTVPRSSQSGPWGPESSVSSVPHRAALEDTICFEEAREQGSQGCHVSPSDLGHFLHVLFRLPADQVP